MSAIELTVGSVEIGTLISSVLFGITSVQVYLYYKNAFRDNLFIRVMVPALWVAEALHTSFTWTYLYRLTVRHYGDIDIIIVHHWTLGLSAIFNGFIGATVQAWFAYRIYVLSQYLSISIVSWTGSSLQMICLISMYPLTQKVTLTEFAARYNWLPMTALGLNVLVDFVNTGSLTYLLWKQKPETMLSSKLVNRLILWTIETGLLTSVSAVVMLVAVTALSHTYLWIGVSFFYAKLYSNSFFASLNGRMSLRNVDTLSSGILSTMHVTNGPVEVTVVRDIHVDDNERNRDMFKLSPITDHMPSFQTSSRETYDP